MVADPLRGARCGPVISSRSSIATTSCTSVRMARSTGSSSEGTREALVGSDRPTWVTMCWPIVMFHHEFVWFEWNCVDGETRETIAKGSVAWVRRGHRGGCYFKGNSHLLSRRLRFGRAGQADPGVRGSGCRRPVVPGHEDVEARGEGHGAARQGSDSPSRTGRGMSISAAPSRSPRSEDEVVGLVQRCRAAERDSGWSGSAHRGAPSGTARTS